MKERTRENDCIFTEDVRNQLCIRRSTPSPGGQNPRVHFQVLNLQVCPVKRRGWGLGSAVSFVAGPRKTGKQSLTHKFAPKVHLSLKCIYSDCGRKSEHLEGGHGENMQTEGHEPNQCQP